MANLLPLYLFIYTTYSYWIFLPTKEDPNTS